MEEKIYGKRRERVVSVFVFLGSFSSHIYVLRFLIVFLGKSRLPTNQPKQTNTHFRNQIGFPIRYRFCAFSGRAQSRRTPAETRGNQGKRDRMKQQVLDRH